MRTQVFSRLMAQLEQLTPQQGQVVQEKVIQRQGRYALATLGEARMAEPRGCSRCGAEHLQHWAGRVAVSSVTAVRGVGTA